LPESRRCATRCRPFGALEPVSAAQIRIDAPQAFRSQERAVTEADYRCGRGTLPGVQRAVARVRWTGAWRTVFVYVDRVGGLSSKPTRAS